MGESVVRYFFAVNVCEADVSVAGVNKCDLATRCGRGKEGGSPATFFFQGSFEKFLSCAPSIYPDVTSSMTV